MSAIIVRQSVTTTAAASTRRMRMSTEDGGVSLEVRYAPREVKYGNRARVWSEVEREGQQPILSSGGLPLPRLSFTLTLGDPDPDVDVEDEITALTALAQGTSRIVVEYGAAEAGLWRMTNMEVTSEYRHPVTDAITRATADVELTRASDAAASVGPVSGGSSPTPAPPKTPVAVYMGGTTYVVRKGDTLGKIAQRFYKDPRRWRLIATANKIRNPKQTSQFPNYGKMKPGSKLKIPKVRK